MRAGTAVRGVGRLRDGSALGCGLCGNISGRAARTRGLGRRGPHRGRRAEPELAAPAAGAAGVVINVVDVWNRGYQKGADTGQGCDHSSITKNISQSHFRGGSPRVRWDPLGATRRKITMISGGRFRDRGRRRGRLNVRFGPTRCLDDVWVCILTSGLLGDTLRSTPSCRWRGRVQHRFDLDRWACQHAI